MATQSYLLKMNTQMGKLMRSYSELVGVPRWWLRFLFDGHRIEDHETPRQLGMKQDDEIAVFQGLKSGPQLIFYGKTKM